MVLVMRHAGMVSGHWHRRDRGTVRHHRSESECDNEQQMPQGQLTPHRLDRHFTPVGGLMHSLPLFVRLAGRPVALIGSGPAADAKRRLQKTGYNAVAEAQSMLDVYNKAYAALTQDGRPNAFRDFLLSAPSMFSELGERLGAIQHINSFWSYRFPKRQPKTILPEELMDLLLDFEDSLAISKQDA